MKHVNESKNVIKLKFRSYKQIIFIITLEYINSIWYHNDLFMNVIYNADANYS